MTDQSWQELECPHCHVDADILHSDPNYPLKENATVKCQFCDKYFQIEAGKTIFNHGAVTASRSLGQIGFEAFTEVKRGPHSWWVIPEKSKEAWEAAAAAIASVIQRKTESATMFTDEEIVVLKQYVEYQRIKPIADFGFTHNPRTFQVPQSGMSLNTSPLTLCTEGPEDFMIGNTDPEPERG